VMIDDPQLASLTITELGCIDQLYPRVTVDTLPDDALLEIFDFYLVRPDWEFKREDAWHVLVHVCKRWRSIVFCSPHRLRLRLLCRNTRPMMQNALNLWPALPIVIRGRRGMSRPQVANNIIAALKHHNRVCDIDIDDILNTLLQKIWTMRMKNSFPLLTSLRLNHSSGNINAPPLPDSFLGGSAPRLQTLSLEGIPFPGLQKLLLSTRDLVQLRLWDIPPSGYISPEAIITGLSALTKFQKLHLGFRCPRSQAAREDRLLPRLTRIVLPTLTSFYFKGDSEYMEDIAGQIDTPLLDRLDITFFNQLTF
jgi:F-box-like